MLRLEVEEKCGWEFGEDIITDGFLNLDIIIDDCENKSWGFSLYLVFMQNFILPLLTSSLISIPSNVPTPCKQLPLALRWDEISL